MITNNISRFVNVRLITNVITNLVDVMGATSVRGGCKPALKPGKWCASHSDHSSDSCSQEPSERGCREPLGKFRLARLMPASFAAYQRLAAARATLARQAFADWKILGLSAV